MEILTHIHISAPKSPGLRHALWGIGTKCDPVNRSHDDWFLAIQSCVSHNAEILSVGIGKAPDSYCSILVANENFSLISIHKWLFVHLWITQTQQCIWSTCTGAWGPVFSEAKLPHSHGQPSMGNWVSLEYHPFLSYQLWQVLWKSKCKTPSTNWCTSCCSEKANQIDLKCFLYNNKGYTHALMHLFVSLILTIP